MLIKRISALTHIEHEMDLPVTEEQLLNYEKGMFAQDAFKNLTPEQREFIMTGIIPEEWNDMFPDEGEPEIVHITNH